MDTTTVTISVTGMTCNSCVNNIESVIGERDDVKHINVSLTDNEAVVEYYPHRTTVQELCEAIEDMGFDAELKQTNNDTDNDLFQHIIVNVEGMTCQSCVNNIESVIGERTHVRTVKVSLENRTAAIEYNSLHETPLDLCEAICDMGFDAYLPDTTNTEDTVTIDIEGMTCMSCVNTITETMSSEPGVKSIVVSLQDNNAVVVYDGTLTSVAALCERIEDMGFDATLAGSPAVIDTGETSDSTRGEIIGSLNQADSFVLKYQL